MKKIDAIISRRNFPIIKAYLGDTGTIIVDKRNLDDSDIYDGVKSVHKDSRFRSIPLAKIEMVVSNKDAKKIIKFVSKNSGLSSTQGGRIFVSEMEEIVDMDTLDGQQDIEITLDEMPKDSHLPKKSRFVPLQKFTLYRLQITYEKNKEILQSDYRVKSFSGFVNYCIRKHIPILEKQLRNPTMVYEDNFGNF